MVDTPISRIPKIPVDSGSIATCSSGGASFLLFYCNEFLLHRFDATESLPTKRRLRVFSS